MAQSGENEIEHAIRDTIQEKIKCSSTYFIRCNDKVLEDLISEMNSIKLELLGINNLFLLMLFLSKL